MENNQPQQKRLRVSQFLPGIVWFILILVLICLPSSKLPEADDWMIRINYDKLIHVAMFAVLAYLFMHPIIQSDLANKLKWHYIVKLAIATIIWGLVTELIQRFFIPSRSFNLSDWLADGIGGIAALVYARTRLVK